jgi:hypothetical protein
MLNVFLDSWGLPEKFRHAFHELLLVRGEKGKVITGKQARQLKTEVYGILYPLNLDIDAMTDILSTALIVGYLWSMGNYWYN